MKKYKFKLEALLRIRKFREKIVKQELGEIVSSIETTKEKQQMIEKEIFHYYKLQERSIRSGISAGELSLYPKILQTKRYEAKNTKENFDVLDQKYKEKVKELETALKEVRIIKNMKEKYRELFRKERNKENQRNIEELTQFRMLRRD